MAIDIIPVFGSCQNTIPRVTGRIEGIGNILFDQRVDDTLSILSISVSYRVQRRMKTLAPMFMAKEAKKRDDNWIGVPHVIVVSTLYRPL